MLDGFVSALHYYEGEQLDAVVERVADRLNWPGAEVRALLVDQTNAVLGAYPVPHLRDRNVQWSPADDFLIGGEIVRRSCSGDSLSISGRLLI